MKSIIQLLLPLLTTLTLISCTPVQAHDRYAPLPIPEYYDNETNYDKQWQIRYQSALDSVANGSVLSVDEIMDLYYCTDVLNRTGTIGYGCAG